MAVISAKRQKIPVFHMEAGNRCFDQRVPEELNRKVLDHLSDINFVLTEHARRYLIAEGIRPETIIKSGSHMGEVLDYYKQKIEKSKILDDLNLESGKYFIVSAHREENVDSEQNFNDLLDSLNAIAEEYGKRVIVSTHPRTRKKLESMTGREFNTLIEFMAPLGFFDYIAGNSVIHTDRLHIAIGSCLLGKEVHMYPGRYFKNRAIFDASITGYFENVHLHDVFTGE